MNLEEYGQMYQLESTHWYFVGKVKLIERIVRQNVGVSPELRFLDVGCGTGNILQMLSRHGSAVGLDISHEALHFCRMRSLDKLCLAQPDSFLPFTDESFDVVSAFDMLEHVDEDWKLLLEIKRVCRKGGKILLTVPAHPFLWSEHDVALHHRRRYTKASFRSLIGKANLHIVRFSYANSFLFPVAVAYRTLRKVLKHDTGQVQSEFFVNLPRLLNRLLLSIFVCEGGILSRLNLPMGLSLLTVCEKKG